MYKVGATAWATRKQQRAIKEDLLRVPDWAKVLKSSNQNNLVFLIDKGFCFLIYTLQRHEW